MFFQEDVQRGGLRIVAPAVVTLGLAGYAPAGTAEQLPVDSR
jgi:hypothetical protein